MKKLCNFTFKFKRCIDKKLVSCRIDVELIKITSSQYQVVIYMYKGNDIFNVLKGCASCYTFVEDYFFSCTKREYINQLILQFFI